MLPIRIKAVSESDLRMLGNLARNIQRVLPVTQADIDAAAALGKGWVVWKVIEVTDPIDNLRGGTQLVIKENSITPGKNIRRVLIVSGPSGETVVIGPGESPLLLPDAIANTLSYVKAFGGTKQAEVPDGYQQVMYVDLMSGGYLTTDIVPTYDGRVEFDFMTASSLATEATTYLGVRSSSSGNGGLRVAHISTKVFRIYGYGSYKDSSAQCQPSTRYKFVWDNQHATLTTGGTTVFDETYTNTGDNTYPVTINGWNSAGTVTAGVEDVFVYSLKIWNAQGELVANYIPCKKLDPLTVGFYDTVSKSFKSATAGTFAAGPDVVPLPTAPLPIYCNNGEIKFGHQSGLPLGYTLVDGITNAGNTMFDIGVKDNTDDMEYEIRVAPRGGSWYILQSRDGSSGPIYGVSGANSGSKINFGAGTGISVQSAITRTVGNVLYLRGYHKNGSISLYVKDETDDTEDTQTDTYNTASFVPATSNIGLFGNGTNFLSSGTAVYSAKIWKNGILVADYVPAKDSNDVAGFYDRVSQTFKTPGAGSVTAGTEVLDPLGLYAAGPVETIADSTNHLATCENLFSLGQYTDVQSILDGIITRKLGILYLDGTEDWKYSSHVIYANLVPADMQEGDKIGLCTHFQYSNARNIAAMSVNSCIFNTTGTGLTTGNFSMKSTSFTSLATGVAWVKAQYDAGKPVILVYALASSETANVPGQTLQVADGANTLTITQAGMNGLQLEAEYEKAV